MNINYNMIIQIKQQYLLQFYKQIQEMSKVGNYEQALKLVQLVLNKPISLNSRYQFLLKKQSLLFNSNKVEQALRVVNQQLFTKGIQDKYFQCRFYLALGSIKYIMSNSRSLKYYIISKNIFETLQNSLDKRVVNNKQLKVLININILLVLTQQRSQCLFYNNFFNNYINLTDENNQYKEGQNLISILNSLYNIKNDIDLIDNKQLKDYYTLFYIPIFNQLMYNLLQNNQYRKVQINNKTYYLQDLLTQFLDIIININFKQLSYRNKISYVKTSRMTTDILLWFITTYILTYQLLTLKKQQKLLNNIYVNYDNKQIDLNISYNKLLSIDKLYNLLILKMNKEQIIDKLYNFISILKKVQNDFLKLFLDINQNIMFDNMYNEKHIKYKIDFFFEIKDLFLNLPNFLNNNYISILQKWKNKFILLQLQNNQVTGLISILDILQHIYIIKKDYSNVVITNKLKLYLINSIQVNKYRKYIENNLQLQSSMSDNSEYIKKLQQSNSILQNFAYILSHDLKTPLRNIINFSSLLKKYNEHQLDNIGLQSLNYLIMSGKRMNQLIQSSLYYAQIGNNIKKQQCCLIQILQNMESNLIQELIMKNIKFKINYESLPLKIITDKVLITNVLINFVSNAIKACNKQKDSFIEIGCVNTNWIYIKDNGIGMTQYQKQKIFNLFYKVDNKSTGLGLGMTIVKRILDKLGSTIIVQSKKNQGTIFYFNVQIFNQEKDI